MQRVGVSLMRTSVGAKAGIATRLRLIEKYVFLHLVSVTFISCRPMNRKCNATHPPDSHSNRITITLKIREMAHTHMPWKPQGMIQKITESRCLTE